MQINNRLTLWVIGMSEDQGSLFFRGLYLIKINIVLAIESHKIDITHTVCVGNNPIAINMGRDSTDQRIMGFVSEKNLIIAPFQPFLNNINPYTNIILYIYKLILS